MYLALTQHVHPLIFFFYLLFLTPSESADLNTCIPVHSPAHLSFFLLTPLLTWLSACLSPCLPALLAHLSRLWRLHYNHLLTFLFTLTNFTFLCAYLCLLTYPPPYWFVYSDLPIYLSPSSYLLLIPLSTSLKTVLICVRHSPSVSIRRVQFCPHLPFSH